MKPATESYTVASYWRGNNHPNKLEEGAKIVASFQNAIRYSYIEIIKCSLTFQAKAFLNNKNIQVTYRYFLSNSNNFVRHDEKVEQMADPDKEEFTITVTDKDDTWLYADLTTSLKRKLRETLTYKLHVSLLIESITPTSENSGKIVMKTFQLSFEVRAKGIGILFKEFLWEFRCSSLRYMRST